jgi:hypothetical protein
MVPYVSLMNTSVDIPDVHRPERASGRYGKFSLPISQFREILRSYTSREYYHKPEDVLDLFSSMG